MRTFLDSLPVAACTLMAAGLGVFFVGAACAGPVTALAGAGLAFAGTVIFCLFVFGDVCHAAGARRPE